MNMEAVSVEDYINQVPNDRRSAFIKLINVIRENIPEGFHEELNYKMPGWVVPKSIYPARYHCDTFLPLPFLNLANQKNFIGFYHLGIYSDKELLSWFIEEYAKVCKYKLDMSKSCIRFKKMSDIPYDLIGELCSKISVDRWISIYEDGREKNNE